MPHYLILSGWTEHGIQEIKESPKRLDAAKKVFKTYGAELKEFYMVMGQYDMAMIVEAPDDEALAKIALQIARQGSIRTQTMRLFTEGEYRKIIDALP